MLSKKDRGQSPGRDEEHNMKQVRAEKAYVQVIVAFRDDGAMLPRAIVWEDGKKYVIDKVTEIKQAAAMKVGGQGDRYTIWIGGRQSYLFFERNASVSGCNIGRWFVEKKCA